MLDQDQLAQLKEIGRCQFNISEAATILAVDEKLLREKISNKKTEEYNNYYCGKLQADFEVRKRVLELAISGSVQAQEFMMKLKMKSELDEI